MDPEYISGSPTVMSYDYQNNDYFAPAVYGQQTPEQAAVAAAKAADPILASIPATAPLVAHPVPGYPKQGHVPHFTMPMNAGEWNIKGVNMPTYSPALPPIPGSGWRTAPMPTDAVYSNPALPRRGAYAGYAGFGDVTIKDYSKPGIGRSREVQDGGYRYRQYADGAIMILITERPDILPVGTIMKGVQGDPYYKNWVAITGKIGAWADFKKQRGEAILKGAAAAAGTTAELAKAFTKGKGKKRRKAAAAAPEADELPAPVVAEEPSLLSGPLPWIVGGVVVVGLVLLMGRGGSSGQGK